MIKIDEEFLNQAGLSEMPEDKKEVLLRNAQEEMERRVGERMSKGMSLEQLREFDGIMNEDEMTMKGMLAKIGDYETDSIFQKVLSKHSATELDMGILKEYLSVKWIQTNRPDYMEVIKAVILELKGEIMASKAQLM